MKLTREHFESLSPRQREVALLLANGLTNADIAKCLEMTVHTVKAHRAEVMRRMEVFTFADLVGQLLSLKLSEIPSDSGRINEIRIIVVEDDPWHRGFLTDSLNEHGFIAIGVADGEEFNRVSLHSPTDIVILDIELGVNKENGISIATKLLEKNACGIIMVTAHGESEERIRGLSVGADAYFSKPVNINELVLTITNLSRRIQRSGKT